MNRMGRGKQRHLFVTDTGTERLLWKEESSGRLQKTTLWEMGEGSFKVPQMKATTNY